MMYSLMLLKGFLVGVLVATQSARLFDLEVNDLDMTFEDNEMFESFSAGGALVRAFSHMID